MRLILLASGILTVSGSISTDQAFVFSETRMVVSGKVSTTKTKTCLKNVQRRERCSSLIPSAKKEPVWERSNFTLVLGVNKGHVKVAASGAVQGDRTLICSTIGVSVLGYIDASGRGCSPGFPTALAAAANGGGKCEKAVSPGGGGGHGGTGGDGCEGAPCDAPQQGGKAYGSCKPNIACHNEPLLAGGGGGCSSGGSGGGVIIISSGIVSISGKILANGAAGSAGQAGSSGGNGGGGAGGSIIVEFSQLRGSGIVAANGGNGFGNSDGGYGGGGGGGRIFMQDKNEFNGGGLSWTRNFSGNFSFFGGSGGFAMVTVGFQLCPPALLEAILPQSRSRACLHSAQSAPWALHRKYERCGRYQQMRRMSSGYP